MQLKSGGAYIKGKRRLVPLAKAVFEALLPVGVQRRVRDRVEDFRRHHPAPHVGLKRFGVPRNQVYPYGIHFDDCLRNGMTVTLAGLVLRPETPVASIGSCFADEFASHMRARGFNYVDAESQVFPASANWGRVYTIAALRQIVRYSTAADFPVAIERAPQGWFDPLREPSVGFFATRADADIAIRAHREASRRAFTAARVLIITLGQNEAWTDRTSGLTWAHIPPPTLLDEGRFEPQEFSFEDNVIWLEDSVAALRRLNADLDVLLTVSPVASNATFCGKDAVTQSFAGKCLLRTVAERVSRTVPRVWYFPAFEMALAYNPHTLNADNRHVKNATVDRIFALLQSTSR
jgi:hypothetical protein